MDKILFILAIALLYSSSSLAADEGRATDGFQHNLITNHKDGSNEKKPTFWLGRYAQFTSLNLTTKEELINNALARNRRTMESYIGPGVTPLFGTYSIVRTNGKQDGSAYVALGFNLDELTRDEADTSYSSNDRDLSLGFGVNNTFSNIEYMMYVNEDNYEISAISLGYISKF